jgi:hypothetical protein
MVSQDQNLSTPQRQQNFKKNNKKKIMFVHILRLLTLLHYVQRLLYQSVYNSQTFRDLWITAGVHKFYTNTGAISQF